MIIDIEKIEALIDNHGKEKKSVIPILQAIQKEFNYLPEAALEKVCQLTEITPAQIVSVASFYSQFRFKPAGEHIIKICSGTACHVKGSEQVYDAFKREFKLEGAQDTDSSGKYTIEKVN